MPTLPTLCVCEKLELLSYSPQSAQTTGRMASDIVVTHSIPINETKAILLFTAIHAVVQT